MIKYFQITVPHSGTRYINDAVGKATEQKVIQVRSLKQWKSHGEPESVFCHIGRKREDMIRYGIESAQKPWMTIRSPIATWATNWEKLQAVLHKGEFGWKERLGQLREQYEFQQDLVKEYPHLYVHKVEEDIKKLGQYLDLTLDPNSNRFSTPSEMKVALKERNKEVMNELCNDTDYFECFRDSITPDIQDFYEGYGYEIWWT